jgi:drug/metabolite transporter (DMT)-like permease
VGGAVIDAMHGAMTQDPDNGRAWRVIAAFAAVYIVWGSTYLAIRFAIETLPPFLMAATRFLIAGSVLHAWGRLRGDPAPARAHLAPSFVLGALFLLLGNGGVVWAEQRIPSGLAALLVAVTPAWTVLFEWAHGGGMPGLRTIAGLAAGLAGVALLVAPSSLGGARLDLAGAAGCLLSSVSWSLASVRSRTMRLPPSPAIASSLQMLAGGALLLLVGLASGEAARVDLAAASTRSLLAVAYLVVFGSLVAFTAFTWLLRVSTPSRVATCAYVNPVVAVLLGWAFAGERLGTRSVVAAAAIVLGVVLITTGRSSARRAGRGRVEE